MRFSARGHPRRQFEKDSDHRRRKVLYARVFGAITGFASARYSNMRVGVFDFSEEYCGGWDNPEVTILDRLAISFEIASAEIIDISVKSPLPGRFHHFLEEVCSLRKHLAGQMEFVFLTFAKDSTARSKPFRRTNEP